MFTKPLNYIITKENLLRAYEDINKKSSGLDDVSFIEFEKNLKQNIKNIIESIRKGEYSPEPLKKIHIDKLDSEERRSIAISSIKDKIVQRTLYQNMNAYFDKTFSNSSFAYRAEMSTLQAINNTTSILNQKKFIILKTDIENFFDTINHDILLAMLDKTIKDKALIRIISLFLQVGGFHKQNYDEHLLGVYQGDILSPLLSNIYLDAMDKYLDEKAISFVRYADDFILFFTKKEDAYVELKLLKKFLNSIKLSLNQEKTKIVHIKDGFTFLGVDFKGRNRNIQEKRVQKSLNKIELFSKSKLGFLKFIQNINDYLRGLKNYYLKILTKNSPQYISLQEAIVQTLSHKVFLAKLSREITTKKEFKVLLEQVKLKILFEEEQIKHKIDLIIAMGYEEYLSSRSYKDSTSKLLKKKNTYAKKFADDSTLHILVKGLMLGISKNRFVLKRYGKVQKSFPISSVSRIVFEGKGHTLSTDVIKRCAEGNISIDFINTNALNYASLVTYKASMTQSINRQSKLLGTPIHLELAREFIRGKAKNQLNYIKYLNKYHQLLDQYILSIEKNILELKSAATTHEIMGHEGSISASYWESIRLILDTPFSKRITFGAKDIVNSSLNYGYAFLYGKVQHSLVHAGLSLNVSFLHSLDSKKPTLTYDMIEEFRTFIVDRTIVSMLNKDEPISLGNDGMLTLPSRKLIAKNIKEKLGSYTMWHKESVKIENIIQAQSFNLAKVINHKMPKYKAFIGKY